MEIVEIYILTIIITNSISCLFLSFIICIFVSFPKKFMKHPNDIYFYSVISQLMYLIFNSGFFCYLYMIIKGSKINLDILKAFMFIFGYFALVTLIYILALNCEILLKLFKKSIQVYKKRKIFYHIISIGIPFVLIFSYIVYTDFTMDLSYDGLFVNRKMYDVFFWCVVVLTILLIIMVASYMKRLISSKSKGLLTMTILTIGLITNFFITYIIPEILYTFRVYFEYPASAIIAINSILGSLGLFQFIIIVCNKKCLRFLKINIIRKLRSTQNKSIKEFIDIPLTKSMIIRQINLNDSLNDEEELLSDIFDSITKKVTFI